MFTYYNPKPGGHYPPEDFHEQAYWSYRAWENLTLEEEEYALQCSIEEEACHQEYHALNLEWYEHQHLA